MMPTLLEKALADRSGAARRGGMVSSEMVDLAIAFYTGEICSRQVGSALGCEEKAVSIRMGSVLLRAVRQRLLRLEKVADSTGV